MSDKSDLLAELVAADATIQDLFKEIRRLRRENFNLLEATGWQPIETAPKDGAWALVYADGAINCAYVKAGRLPVDLTHPANPNVFPAAVTHWMPLPKPPAVEGE